jgi:hypothetical protein
MSATRQLAWAGRTLVVAFGVPESRNRGLLLSASSHLASRDPNPIPEVICQPALRILNSVS